MKPSFDEKYLVASVKNSMRILRLFKPKQNELGITEIAKQLDLSKSTVHRYVKELVKERFLIQSNGKYRLGLANLALGGIVQYQKEIYADAIPILEKLANQFQLAAHICVLEQHHVVYLLREMGHQDVKLVTKSGRSNDVHCTAEGQAILAFKSEKVIHKVISRPLKKYTKHTVTDPEILLEQLLSIRYEQYAITKETYAIGFISFAVPIRDYTGEVVSSLALIGPSKNINEGQYGEVVNVLRKSGKEVSEMLGYYDD